MSPVVDTSLDGHVHTRLCRHAAGEMEAYVRAAISRGLATIVFLEHFEVDIHYSHRIWLSDADFEYYFREGERLRSLYRDDITIRLGAEVGWNGRSVERLQERLASFPWEHLGLSCHFYWDGQSHLNLLSKQPDNIRLFAGLDTDAILREYLDGLLVAVETLSCNVLCHLDAALRYVPDCQWTDAHFHQVDRLLAAVRKAGMSLEINTSGFDIRNEPFPCRAILQQARQQNIPFICGSDAHYPEQVGRYFEQVPEMLASINEQE